MVTEAQPQSKARLGIVEVAARYQRSRKWVYKLVEARRIPHMRLGGSIFFTEEMLKDWEQTNTVGKRRA